MIKLGKVYENLMIDATDEQKLVSRAQHIIHEITGVTLDEAKEYLTRYGSVKNRSSQY